MVDNTSPHSGTLKIAPMDRGCCIRIEGRGTMKESPAVREVALSTLRGDAHAIVVIDLSACDYLDSTFLGLMMELYGGFGKGGVPRIFVAASPETRKKLLGPCRIDKILPSIEPVPAIRGPWLSVVPESLKPQELTRHIMECHRALAEVDSPMRAAFTKIADQLERELPST